MKIELTHAELQALHRFISKITLGQLDTVHEATALRKLYIHTGKTIAQEQCLED